MVVANDVTSLCVLCIWVVLAVCAGGRVRWPRSPPGADSAAEEAVIVFGAYRPTVLAQSTGCPANCRALRSTAAMAGGGSTTGDGVLTCFPGAGGTETMNCRMWGRRQGM